MGKRGLRRISVLVDRQPELGRTARHHRPAFDFGDHEPLDPPVGTIEPEHKEIKQLTGRFDTPNGIYL